VEVVQWLIQEGKANINDTSADGRTPLMASLQAEIVNIAVPRFLLSVGARVSTLDDPIFTGLTKAWNQEEVQKREVRILFSASCFFYYFCILLTSLPIWLIAATVRALRQELPTMPTAIANMVGQYMSSLDWEETATRLML
jgi:hypothetical protein